MKNLLKNNEIKQWLQKQSNKVILGVFIFMSILVVILQNISHDQKPVESSSESADTVIPKGYVLVPIELQNADSMSSLVGAYGVVDLFTANKFGQKGGIKVGSRLKLIRAPLNPSQFAVLVPENQSASILASSGPFVATVQNPNQFENSKVILKSKKISKIDYL